MVTPRQVQQQPQNKRVSRLHVVILIFAILLTIVSVVVGIQTQWGANVFLVLTAFGFLLGLFQLLVPLPGSPPLVSRSRKSSSTNNEYEILHKQLEKNHKSGDRGALIIYTRRRLVGCKVLLNDPDGQLIASTYIAERSINHRTIYVGVVENLKPDIYHVELKFRTEAPVEYATVIAVQAGEVAELRWLGRFFNLWYGKL